MFAPSMAVTVTVTLGNGNASLPVRVMTFKKPYAVFGAIFGTGSNSTTGVCSSGLIEGNDSVGVGLIGGVSGVVAVSVGAVEGSGGVAMSDGMGSGVGSSGVSVNAGGKFSGNTVEDSDSGTGNVSEVGGKFGIGCKGLVGVAGAAAMSASVGIGVDSAMVSCAGWARR